jgi:hypothetical protein
MLSVVHIGLTLTKICFTSTTCSADPQIQRFIEIVWVISKINYADGHYSPFCLCLRAISTTLNDHHVCMSGKWLNQRE